MASTSKTARNELMFHEFCTLCETISTSRRDKKADILQKFIANYRATTTESFYTVLRLLIPSLDRERAAYGIKETTLARIYIRVLCLHPESADALKLKNFRAPKNAGDSAGDFGDVAYWVLRTRCSEGKELSLRDVHSHLDTIALRHAEKKPREVDRELEVMLRRMSAQELKWLIRLVLKDMRLGLGQNRLLSLYHPDAREMHDFTNSLQQVCKKLNDPCRRLHEVEVTLFTPCRPMLAERCDVQDIDRHFIKHPGARYAETKLDGERSQLHYSNGKFKFFSRNAFDFTDSFGCDETAGSLAPYLSKQLKSGLRNCILDGEMMPWNTKYKCFGSKAMKLDVKSLRVGNTYQPCFCVFDVLLFNDVVLTNKPLSERLAMLEHIFTPCPGIMMEPSRQIVQQSDKVLAVLNNAIDNLEEGIVVKEPNSIYKPNARKDGWIKIKPEYTPGAMVELDLLIIGGYYGEGRRRGIISHFLLAVAQPPPTAGGEPVVFESMSRVGSGCTMEELADMSRKLEPHWQRLRPGHQPTGLLWTRERPDLWIEPRNSVILQVKATEVVRSDMYQTGYSLRFPRIEKVRYDKPWFNCLTTDEFSTLRQSGSGSLVSSHISQRVTLPASRKRRAPARQEPTVAPQCCNTNLDHVTAVSQLFAGREICVLTGLPEHSKQQMECSIAENGGSIVLNPGKNTYCVIVGVEKNLRVNNVCKAGVYDVVRAQWLVRCLDEGELLAWSPADMVSTAPHTAAWLARQYDCYGDSYTFPATADSLHYSLTLIDDKEISLEQMLEMDVLLFGGTSPFSIFRGCVAYFDCYKEVENESLPLKSLLTGLMFDFKFHSGQVSSKITRDTTHIVLYSCELDRLEELIGRAKCEGSSATVVQHHWMRDCLEAAAHLTEDQYLLHHWTQGQDQGNVSTSHS